MCRQRIAELEWSKVTRDVEFEDMLQAQIQYQQQESTATKQGMATNQLYFCSWWWLWLIDGEDGGRIPLVPSFFAQVLRSFEHVDSLDHAECLFVCSIRLHLHRIGGARSIDSTHFSYNSSTIGFQWQEFMCLVT